MKELNFGKGLDRQRAKQRKINKTWVEGLRFKKMSKRIMKLIHIQEKRNNGKS